MIIETEKPAVSKAWARLAMKRSAEASFLAAVSLLTALVVQAESPSQGAILLAQASEVLALGGAVLAAGFGLGHLVARRPDLRRTLAIVLAVTSATFLAHLYIIDSPPTFTPRSLSGAVGTALVDDSINATSTLTGSVLTVQVSDRGAAAIGALSIFYNGMALPAAALSFGPTDSVPMQPSNSSSLGFPTETSGTWTVGGASNPTIRVDYKLLTCYHPPTLADSQAVYGCVMDEVFYVPTAQGMLQGTQCAPYVPKCNLEHPPLSKALMAAGMAVFGANGYGWRVSNVALGSLSVALLFALVMVATGRKRLSVFAMVLFAADTMFFVHSSIGVIDVPVVFFSLLGSIFYFWRGSFWKVDNYVASGVFFGLAVLSKETGIFSLLGVLTFDLVFARGGVKAVATRLSKVVLASFAMFAGALQLFDTIFTSAAQPWFFQHVGFMISYGSSLTASVLACAPTTGYWCKFPGMPGGPPILPTDWLLFYSPVAYLATNITAAMAGGVGRTLVGVGYFGLANPVVVWMVFAWVPVVAYRTWKGFRSKTTLSREDRFGAFALVLFAWNYLPYIVLFLYGRVTYPFYLIPAIPALAVGAAYFITRDYFPSKMPLPYIGGAFVIFFLYFPVKDFLPIAIRVLLGR